MRTITLLRSAALALFVLALSLPASALCVKHRESKSAFDAPFISPVASFPSSSRDADRVVCLFTDSLHALLPEVKASFAGTTLTSSWDGRIVLTSAQVGDSITLCLSGSAVDSASLVVHASDMSRTLVCCLSTHEAAVAVIKREKGRHSAGVGTVYYSKAATLDAVYADYAVESSEVLSLSSVAVDKAAAMPVSSDFEEADIELPSRTPGAVNSVSAGLLTAGEVNDFAHWSFWPTVLDSTHRQYISQWRMRPSERYVLQLTGRDGFPLVDRAVSLLDAQGNTLFQARTDNTGRAELWVNLFTSSRPVSGTLLLEAEGQRISALPFAEGVNLIRTDEQCAPLSTADVFFIFDATGSMGDELRYLQAEMKDVIARSQSAVEGLSIRTGALVYRDHTDDYVTRISRLSDDITLTQSFIDAQRAAGGGDYEEAVPEALMAAIQAAGWSDEARARIAFLVLDAPCHDDSATIALLHDQVLTAAAYGIRLVPVVCSGLRGSGELLLRSLALVTNGTSFFLTDDSGIGDSHLRPTTDSLVVEHLNDMLVRTIISFTRMPDCDTASWAEAALEDEPIEAFLPDPFSINDLDTIPAALPEQPLSAVLLVRPNPCQGFCLVSLPLGADALYLSDVSGKTIASYGAVPAGTTDMALSVEMLSRGVYFVKAFYGARWYTQKLIVR